LKREIKEKGLETPYCHFHLDVKDVGLEFAIRFMNYLIANVPPDQIWYDWRRSEDYKEVCRDYDWLCEVYSPEWTAKRRGE
jgi:hypothetical protein